MQGIQFTDNADDPDGDAAYAGSGPTVRTGAWDQPAFMDEQLPASLTQLAALASLLQPQHLQQQPQPQQQQQQQVPVQLTRRLTGGANQDALKAIGWQLLTQLSPSTASHPAAASGAASGQIPCRRDLPDDLDTVPQFFAPFEIRRKGVVHDGVQAGQEPIKMGSGLYLLHRKAIRCDQTALRQSGAAGHSFKAETCQEHSRRRIDKYALGYKVEEGQRAPDTLRGILPKFTETVKRRRRSGATTEPEASFRACHELVFWEVHRSEPGPREGDPEGEQAVRPRGRRASRTGQQLPTDPPGLDPGPAAQEPALAEQAAAGTGAGSFSALGWLPEPPMRMAPDDPLAGPDPASMEAQLLHAAAPHGSWLGLVTAPELQLPAASCSASPQPHPLSAPPVFTTGGGPYTTSLPGLGTPAPAAAPPAFPMLPSAPNNLPDAPLNPWGPQPPAHQHHDLAAMALLPAHHQIQLASMLQAYGHAALHQSCPAPVAPDQFSPLHQGPGPDQGSLLLPHPQGWAAASPQPSHLRAGCARPADPTEGWSDTLRGISQVEAVSTSCAQGGPGLEEGVVQPLREAARTAESPELGPEEGVVQPLRAAARTAESPALGPEELEDLALQLLLAIHPPPAELEGIERLLQRDPALGVEQYRAGIEGVLGKLKGPEDVGRMSLPGRERLVGRLAGRVQGPGGGGGEEGPGPVSAAWQGQLGASLARGAAVGPSSSSGDAGRMQRGRQDEGGEPAQAAAKRSRLAVSSPLAPERSTGLVQLGGGQPGTEAGARAALGQSGGTQLPGGEPSPPPSQGGEAQPTQGLMTGPAHWAVTPSLACCFDVGLTPQQQQQQQGKKREEDVAGGGQTAASSSAPAPAPLPSLSPPAPPTLPSRCLPVLLQLAALATLRRHTERTGSRWEQLLRKVDKFKATALHRACRYGEAAVVSWLCGKPDKFGRPCLEAALGAFGAEPFWRPNAPSRQLLLSLTNHSWLALHSATRQGDSHLDAACIFLEALDKELAGNREDVEDCAYFLSNVHWKQGGGSATLCKVLEAMGHPVPGLEVINRYTDFGVGAETTNRVWELRVQGAGGGA